jgi:uncharacterized protein YdeI (YjbR/CyaY-like superfamily)
MSIEIENLLSVKTSPEWRSWLVANCGTAKFCWILVTRKPNPDTVLYLDAVEEALCFGWIDSTGKKGSDTQSALRFSPRSKKSNWTELNKKRVRRLEKLGMMTDEGRKCLPNMDIESFAIHPEVMSALKKDKEAYANFLALPQLYRRIRIDTIQSCLHRNEHELFNGRLKKFIEKTKANKLFGSWHDDGRLLEY